METGTALTEAGPLTGLLIAFQHGEGRALEEIFRLVLPQLRHTARYLLAAERASHTLQPTALINEAFIRLFDGEPVPWENGRHLIASTVTEMRRVLVDHARRADAYKRRRRDVVPLSREIPASPAPDPALVLDLDAALRDLASVSERAAKVVEMMAFGELTSHEVGAALDISYRTVEREWRWSRAWLHKRMYGEDGQ